MDLACAARPMRLWEGEMEVCVGRGCDGGTMPELTR